MGLLTSILELVFVAGAGWFTIYYLIPKIESGELGNILGSPIQQSGATGSGGEEELVTGEMMDAVNGLESGTTEAETPPPPVESAIEMKGGKRSGGGGKGGSRSGSGSKRSGGGGGKSSRSGGGKRGSKGGSGGGQEAEDDDEAEEKNQFNVEYFLESYFGIGRY
jgi:hypothetical protein